MSFTFAVFGLVGSLVLVMPTAAQAQSSALLADGEQVPDFLEYKTRLLALVAVYRHNVTTAADIEQVLGEHFVPVQIPARRGG